MNKIDLRRGDISDIEELQKLFVDTVKAVCGSDYAKEQITMWTSSVENVNRWQKVLMNQFVLVSRDGQTITGFCTLDNGNYVDFLYVHKDYQRQGIAQALYTNIEKEARRLRQTELTADVSKTAIKFFEKMGFRVLEERTVNVKGVELTNFRMSKALTEK